MAMKTNGTLKTYALITAASFLYSLAFDWFYAPNGFSCGGFTGISQIINYFIPVLPVGMMIIAFNVPLFVLGFRKFGFSFLFKSLYTMVLTSVLIDFYPLVFPFAPMDPMLGCLYGGVLMGTATGLLFSREATTGGTELWAWLVKDRAGRLSLGKICLVMDMTVIIIYAAVFRNLLNALYGGLALYVANTVVDMVVYGRNSAKVAYIISEKHEEITRELLARHVGVTMLDAHGAYTGENRTILLCAIRKREVMTVKHLVGEIDPQSFMIMNDTQEVFGKGFGPHAPSQTP